MSLEVLEDKKHYIPSLLWYQNKDYIILSFEVYKCIEKKISFDSNNVYFNVVSNDNNSEYKMEFELFDEINTDDTNYVIDEKTVRVILKKKDNNNWTSLTKDKNLYKNNIKINWNKWVNESDDEEEEQPNNQNSFGGNQQFDFQQMMQNMSGMGGMESMMQQMAGMGGMESMMQNMTGLDDNEEEEGGGEGEEEGGEEGEEEEEFCEDCNIEK